MSKKRLHQWWLNNEYHDNYNIMNISIDYSHNKVVSPYLYGALINFIPYYDYETYNFAFRK